MEVRCMPGLGVPVGEMDRDLLAVRKVLDLIMEVGEKRELLAKAAHGDVGENVVAAQDGWLLEPIALSRSETQPGSDELVDKWNEKPVVGGLAGVEKGGEMVARVGEPLEKTGVRAQDIDGAVGRDNEGVAEAIDEPESELGR